MPWKCCQRRLHVQNEQNQSFEGPGSSGDEVKCLGNVVSDAFTFRMNRTPSFQGPGSSGDERKCLGNVVSDAFTFRINRTKALKALEAVGMKKNALEMLSAPRSRSESTESKLPRPWKQWG